MSIDKVGRNEPCPCGSGKKFKKCCMHKYPREKFVYIGYKEPFQGLETREGQVNVILPSGKKGKADFIFSQTQYTNKSGKDKVISRISGQATVDVPIYLASNFDVIWAIDTNTKLISSQKVSISCFFKCHMKINKEAQRIEVRYQKVGNLAFKNCPDNESEKFAWSRLINRITSSQGYNDKLRIGLITDHDLNNHSTYNNMNLPIYKNLYLPNNFTLLYASSETGKEDLLNLLIAECDKDAKNIFRQLEEQGSANIGDTNITIDQIPNVNFC